MALSVLALFLSRAAIDWVLADREEVSALSGFCMSLSALCSKSDESMPFTLLRRPPNGSARGLCDTMIADLVLQIHQKPESRHELHIDSAQG